MKSKMRAGIAFAGTCLTLAACMSTVTRVRPNDVSAAGKAEAIRSVTKALRSPSYRIRYLEIDFRDLATYPDIRTALVQFGYVMRERDGWTFSAAGRHAGSYDCNGQTDRLGRRSRSCRAFAVGSIRLEKLAFAVVSSRGAETEGGTEYHFHARVVPETPLGRLLATRGILGCGYVGPDGTPKVHPWLGATTDADLVVNTEVNSTLSPAPEMTCPQLPR